MKALDDDGELPQVRDDLLTESKLFQVLDRDFRRERNAFIWTYDVTAYERGKVTLPPVEIKLGALSFSSEAMPLEITTKRDVGDDALRDDFGLAKHAIHWQRWLAIACALALLSLAWHFGKRYYRRYRRLYAHSAPAAPVAPTESPEAWLTRELGLLRAKLEAAGGDPAKTERLVDALGLIVRGYYARRVKAPVEAWTTREFGRRLTSDQQALALTPVLERCDGWKFTGDASLSPTSIVTESLKESERILLKCGT